jgi:hypothetical protein
MLMRNNETSIPALDSGETARIPQSLSQGFEDAGEIEGEGESGNDMAHGDTVEASATTSVVLSESRACFTV